jgi:carbamoyltransferase
LTYILGINAYHGDSAACLIKDGSLLGAAEEERFRRVKHWAGFPQKAIDYCLDAAGIGIPDVEHVAINRDPKANILRKGFFLLRNRPSLNAIRDRFVNARRWTSVAEEFTQRWPQQEFNSAVHHVEHHLAHLASSFLVSPFDEAVVLSVDGSGDFSTMAWGVGCGTKIDIEGRVYFPHSLGIFYEALTQYLGFQNYGDEYKVMGLAPYGEPCFLEEMRQIVRLRNDGSFSLNLGFFRHHHEKIPYEWNDGAPSVGRLFAPALEQLLGPARSPEAPLERRHKDIAHSVQAMYEEAFFHTLNYLRARYALDDIVLAGGCAYNSVANGKIACRGKFKRCYLQSASGDAGGAIGAAFHVWHQLRPDAARFRMDHAYWGPEFDGGAIEATLASKRKDIECQNCRVIQFTNESELIKRTATAIAAGKIIGWFQGRMEWGPRALGNRSIIADPRRSNMKDILNRKIKRRESFRPFAPSILRESVPDWFETDDDVPFMMQVFQIRPERREAIPAVTHVDGSGRLQTVTRETNLRYYRLIESFCDITGVPIVLNTSFNENEPVVCRPEEALDCFLRTRMDVLVLGDHFVERPDEADSKVSGLT